MSGKNSRIHCVGCDTGLPLNAGDRLLVNGQLVEVVGLEDLMEAVRKMKLPQRKRVADELLARAKTANSIPPGMERQYRDALMDEYDRRYLSIM